MTNLLFTQRTLKRQQIAVFQRDRMEVRIHFHLQHHGMVVGRPLVQHFGGRTDKAAGDTAVQPERDDIAGTVRALARPDVAETLEPYRTHGIEIPDDRGRPIHLLHDVAELEAVEELAMAEMDIGDGDALEGNDLRQAWRYPPRQDRVRQAD